MHCVTKLLIPICSYMHSLSILLSIYIDDIQIKSSLNLKGNPMWNPLTAFRAPHTTVQIVAWSPNRPRTQISTPMPSWNIPVAGCRKDKLCTQQLPIMGMIPVIRGWPLAGTTSQSPDAWFWLVARNTCSG